MDSGKDIKTGGSFLHRAPWLIRGVVGAPPDLHAELLADGGVLVNNGRVLAVGSFRELRGDTSGDCRIIDHDETILAPPLINCHTHLELSHLADIAGRAAAPAMDFTGWVRILISVRRQRAKSGTANILANARKALDSLHAGGVILSVDIGNLAESGMIGQDQPGQVLFLQEIIGLAGKSEERALARFRSAGPTEQDTAFESGACRYTAHAPYSCGPELIRVLKNRALAQGHIFSIHVAETLAELEFLQSGTGSLREFMGEMGEWHDTFTVPGMSPVRYLDRLGILDEKTLCVHAVHVTGRDIACLVERRAKVCLCPGSNRLLKAGKSPAAEYLAHGILPGLGTDSLASNDRLNLWQEMMILREDHPALAPAAVFAMATRGGTEALGLPPGLGLAPGGAASFLAVRAAGIKETGQVFDYLTSAGAAIDLAWVA